MTEQTIETGTSDFLATKKDGVAILTMNRPERRNAFSPAMIKAMSSVLEACETDPDIGAVILMGAGGTFCAGGDVKGMVERQGAATDADIATIIHEQRLRHRATAGRLYTMPKPTLAVLPGAAAGAGLALALACDLRLAAENAIMTTAFARVGFSGDFGGSFFMTQLVGPAKARELYFLSERLDMAEALRLGLVNWVVPAERLETKMMEIARRLATGPRVAYRYMKESINRAVSGTWDECLDLEAAHQIHSGLTEDHREAARAFVEKREPVFKGR